MLNIKQSISFARVKNINAIGIKDMFFGGLYVCLWALLLFFSPGNHHVFLFFGTPILVAIALVVVNLITVGYFYPLSLLWLMELTLFVKGHNVFSTARFLLVLLVAVIISIYVMSSRYRDKTILRLIALFAISACFFSATFITYTPAYCDPGDLICNAKAATFE